MNNGYKKVLGGGVAFEFTDINILLYVGIVITSSANLPLVFS